MLTATPGHPLVQTAEGVRMPRSRVVLGIIGATALLTAATLAGCGSNSSSGTSSAGSSPAESSPAESSAGGSAAAGCDPAPLGTAKSGTLTIATSEPVYEPWMVGNDPTNGKGFESAVAYAVADKLGYPKDEVAWTRVGFDEAIAKQDGWDFDINQFTITPERAKVVDFSSGYYDVTQTLITVQGSPISGATTVAAVKDAKLGAMNGTTSLQSIQTVIQPTQQVAIFDDNAVAAQALQNGQIDGLVVDLPTAFYMTGAQLTNGQVVGQLPGTDSATEQLGLLLAKDSPLTPCVTQAVDALRADGTLAALAAQWLTGAGAPVLS